MERLKTSPSFMHSKGYQERSKSRSYDLVAMLDDDEPENPKEVLFELQFMEKIRHILRPSTHETDALLRESEFPLEEKKFSKWIYRFFNLELSKMAIDGMLSEMCLGPASREYFASEISSFTSRVVEEVGVERKVKVIIFAKMEIVTTIYDDERIEEATPGFDHKEWLNQFGWNGGE